MNLQEVAAFAGIVGALAAVASVYYAWRNDRLLGLMPRNKELEKAFPKDENSAAFLSQVHEALKRVTTHRQLRQALVIAREMHFAKPMDDALIEINKRAIELGDLDFSYKVATKAHFAVALDQMLTNTAQAALARGDTNMANKCANRVHFAVSKDNIKKMILEKLGVRVA